VGFPVGDLGLGAFGGVLGVLGVQGGSGVLSIGGVPLADAVHGGEDVVAGFKANGGTPCAKSAEDAD